VTHKEKYLSICAIFTIFGNSPWLLVKDVFLLQAGLALWITILRFMGDLPEPKYHTMDKVLVSILSVFIFSPGIF
jgi:hypothetical protein